MRFSKNSTMSVLAAIVLITVFTGCAERKDPTDVDIVAHPDGWLDPGSEDFHGEYVAAVVAGNADVEEAEQRSGVEGCASCHGADLGRSDEAGCYECHASGNVEKGGHPVSNQFLAPNAAAFHGNLVIEEMGVDTCQNCHGLEFDGGWADVGCYACHPGPSGHPESSVWLAPANPDFHGRAVAELGGTEKCASCHGANYDGGWAELACTPCHAGGRSGHPASSEWLNPTSNRFHANAVASRGVAECLDCHGSDFDGGWTGASCIDCHSSLGG